MILILKIMEADFWLVGKDLNLIYGVSLSGSWLCSTQMFILTVGTLVNLCKGDYIWFRAITDLFKFTTLMTLSCKVFMILQLHLFSATSKLNLTNNL